MAGRNHVVNFALLYNGNMEYYSRSFDMQSIANERDSNFNVLKTIKVDEFNKLLAEMYHIDSFAGTLRDLAGRYLRIFWKEYCSEKRPLETATKEAPIQGINVLEKLFNYYTKIIEYKTEKEKQQKKDKAYREAKNQSALPVCVTFVSQVKSNGKEIAKLEEELEKLKTNEDINLDDEKMEKADSLLEIESKVKDLTRKMSKLLSQQKLIQINESFTPVVSEDYKEFADFFPTMTIKKIEQIEYFHNRIQGILKTKVEENIENLETLACVHENAIKVLKDTVPEMGFSVTVSEGFLKNHNELMSRVAYLKTQNKAFADSQKFAADWANAKKALDDVEMEVLNEISEKINKQMAEYYDFVYDGSKHSPELFFDIMSSIHFILLIMKIPVLGIKACLYLILPFLSLHSYRFLFMILFCSAILVMVLWKE